MSDNPVCRWEICTTDSTALAEFYGKAFGWEIQSIPGVDYVNVGSGDGTDGGIGGGIFNTGGDTPPYLTLYIHVDDVDAKVAELKELGAGILVEPTGDPAAARYAMFRDPQGHVMSIVHFARQSPAEDDQ